MSDNTNSTLDDIPYAAEDIQTLWMSFEKAHYEANNPLTRVSIARDFAYQAARTVYESNAEEQTVINLLEWTGEEMDTFPESKLKDDYETSLSQLEYEDSAAIRLDDLLTNHLVSVRKVKSAGTTVDTTYHWTFENFTLRTRDEHRSQSKFMILISDESELKLDHASHEIDNWWKWVTDFVNDQINDPDGVGEVVER